MPAEPPSVCSVAFPQRVRGRQVHSVDPTEAPNTRFAQHHFRFNFSRLQFSASEPIQRERTQADLKGEEFVLPPQGQWY
jgi:hypothetical protein